MHTALIMAEVLEADPQAPAALAHLTQSGITPVILAPPRWAAGEPGLTPDFTSIRTVSTDAAEAEDHDGAARLSAAARAGIALGGTHFLVAEPSAARRAVESGCRPILVLGDRSLDEVLGPEEPEAKHVGAALDTATAARYVAEELAQLDALGPFGHGAFHLSADGVRELPNRTDLLKFFGLVILAGTAVALGIAYFLRELYEKMTLPSIAYYVTLQFIPEWVRGLLFIGVGIGIGVAASRVVSAERRHFG